MENKDKIAAIDLKAEASSQHTLPERLTELAKINYELAEIVASNVSAPPELLKELASHHSKAVKKAIISNPNTPTETLFELAEHYPQELLANPILDILFLENSNFLASINVSYESLFILVQQPNIPKFLLQNIFNDVEMRYPTKERAKVIEEAELHVNYAGEMTERWHEDAMSILHFEEWSHYTDGMKLPSRYDYVFYSHYDSFFISNFKDFLPSRLFVLDMFKIHGQTLDDDSELLDEHPDWLADFSDRFNWYLQREIAQTTKIIYILRRLADHEVSSIKEAVADNINTPIDTLEKLATDSNEYVRELVAGNSNTPIHILEELAIDEDLDVRLEVAENTNTPTHISKKVLEELATNQDYHIRTLVAENSNVPVHILEKLAIDVDDRVRESVRINSNTPIHILRKSVSDKDIFVLLEAVIQSNLSEEIVERFYRNKDNQHQDILIEIAYNKNTPQDVLTKLSNSEYDDVRTGVARNKNTSLSTLKRLAQEQNIDILLNILEHEKCSIEIKENVLDSFKKLDFNKKIDKGIRTNLWMAYREKCPIEIKEKIFSSLTKASESYFIAFIVLMSDYAKVEDLATYSKSKLWLERYAIAQNKKTPKETLELLAKDCNRIVRATAKESLEKIQYKTESS